MQELNENLKLPQNPGIYQYYDAKGRLLYVGKAKNLKNRIKSYFNFTPAFMPNPKNSLRIQKMIKEARYIDYIISSSEANALILENSFIKQLNPKYNILLRDDKTFPYICINTNEAFPRFETTRKLNKISGVKYFGPFFKGAKELLNALYLSYPLRQKKSCKTPCLFYQIKRCKAPCAGMITEDEYKEIVQNAKKALLKPKNLLAVLEKKMYSYSAMDHFEEAAIMRDQIACIKELDNKIDIDLARLENFDVYALVVQNSLASFIRFIIQDGKLISINSKIIALKESDIQAKELYSQFILENAMKNPLKHANTSYIYEDFEDKDLLADLIAKHFDKKYSIKVPKIGEKKELAKLAFKNAVLNIQKELKSDDFLLLKEMKDYFSLENYPNYIEAFDNSHLQGNAPVAGVIAYKDASFYKSGYRHYHLQANNDYDQMKQSLSQRAARFDKDTPPDLWVIDGGETLLKLALDIVASTGANIDVLAISKEKKLAHTRRAKGAAKDIIYSKYGEYKLSTRDKKLQFLQRLRDESHRFAISFHKKTKQKQDLASSKLVKEGFSLAQIAKLLKYFGSFEAIDQVEHAKKLEIARKRVSKD